MANPFEDRKPDIKVGETGEWFKTHFALDEVAERVERIIKDIQLAGHHTIIMVGHTGAGKSSLLNSIFGFVRSRVHVQKESRQYGKKEQLRDYLRTNFSWLRNALKPKLLAQHLYHQGVISQEDFIRICNTDLRVKGCDKLIGMLVNSSTITELSMVMKVRKAFDDAGCLYLLGDAGLEMVRDEVLSRLDKNMEEILDTVEPIEIIDDLLGSGVVSRREYMEIAEKEWREDKQYLLTILKRKPDIFYPAFCDAIKECYPFLWKKLDLDTQSEKLDQSRDEVLTRLNTNMEEILDTVEPRLIIDDLQRSGVLSRDEYWDIWCTDTREERIKYLMELLREKPDTIFPKFFDAVKYVYPALWIRLVQNNQSEKQSLSRDEILSQLENNLDIVEPRRIIGYLWRSGVLSWDEYADIRWIERREERVRYLMELLRRKQETVYPSLFDAIKNCYPLLWYKLDINNQPEELKSTKKMIQLQSHTIFGEWSCNFQLSPRQLLIGDPFEYRFPWRFLTERVFTFGSEQSQQEVAINWKTKPTKLEIKNAAVEMEMSCEDEKWIGSKNERMKNRFFQETHKIGDEEIEPKVSPVVKATNHKNMEHQSMWGTDGLCSNLGFSKSFLYILLSLLCVTGIQAAEQPTKMQGSTNRATFDYITLQAGLECRMCPDGLLQRVDHDNRIVIIRGYIGDNKGIMKLVHKGNKSDPDQYIYDTLQGYSNRFGFTLCSTDAECSWEKRAKCANDKQELLPKSIYPPTGLECRGLGSINKTGQVYCQMNVDPRPINKTKHGDSKCCESDEGLQPYNEYKWEFRKGPFITTILRIWKPSVRKARVLNQPSPYCKQGKEEHMKKMFLVRNDGDAVITPTMRVNYNLTILETSCLYEEDFPSVNITENYTKNQVMTDTMKQKICECFSEGYDNRKFRYVVTQFGNCIFLLCVRQREDEYIDETTGTIVFVGVSMFSKLYIVIFQYTRKVLSNDPKPVNQKDVRGITDKCNGLMNRNDREISRIESTLNASDRICVIFTSCLTTPLAEVPDLTTEADKKLEDCSRTSCRKSNQLTNYKEEEITQKYTNIPSCTEPHISARKVTERENLTEVDKEDHAVKISQLEDTFDCYICYSSENQDETFVRKIIQQLNPQQKLEQKYVVANTKCIDFPARLSCHHFLPKTLEEVEIHHAAHDRYERIHIEKMVPIDQQTRNCNTEDDVNATTTFDKDFKQRKQEDSCFLCLKCVPKDESERQENFENANNNYIFDEKLSDTSECLASNHYDKDMIISNITDAKEVLAIDQSANDVNATTTSDNNIIQMNQEDRDIYYPWDEELTHLKAVCTDSRHDDMNMNNTTNDEEVSVIDQPVNDANVQDPNISNDEECTQRSDCTESDDRERETNASYIIEKDGGSLQIELSSHEQLWGNSVPLPAPGDCIDGASVEEQENVQGNDGEKNPGNDEVYDHTYDQCNQENDKGGEHEKDEGLDREIDRGSDAENDQGIERGNGQDREISEQASQSPKDEVVFKYKKKYTSYRMKVVEKDTLSLSTVRSNNHIDPRMRLMEGIFHELPVKGSKKLGKRRIDAVCDKKEFLESACGINTDLSVTDLPVPKIEITAAFKELAETQVQSNTPANPNFEPLDAIIKKIADDEAPGPQITMRYEWLRICTLRNYPKDNKPWLTKLAAAGFYYAADGDEVICYCCGLRRHSWVCTDVPERIHQRINPNCKFLNRNAEFNVPIKYEGKTPNQEKIESLMKLLEEESVPAAITNGAEGGGEVTEFARPMPSNASKELNSPKHPQYVSRHQRISSFEGWPDNLTQTPEIMSEAGFYYAGFGDCVRCYYCGIGLRHWTPEDNPWIEHARWSQNCAFVKQVKGQEFINLVQQAVQVSQNNELPGAAAANPSGESNERSQREQDEVERILRTDPAQSVLEMGYQPRIIKQAIDYILKREGKSGISSQKIMEKVLEYEDAESARDLVGELAHMDLNRQDSVSSGPASGASVKSSESKETSAKGASAQAREQPPRARPGRHSGELGRSNRDPNRPNAREIKEENQKLKEQTICKICLDNTVCIVFLPCGHLCTCDDCAPAMRTCPICRQEVKGTVKTFMS